MRSAIASLALAAAVGPASAVTLAPIGPTYPITEGHLIEQIVGRLRDKERTGELQALQDQSRARAIAAVDSPPPVPGLGVALAPRTRYFDPTISLANNILDPQGHVMFPAGTRQNPLDVVSMSRHLLFFDARDARQVRKARELVGTYGSRLKPILVGGSYMALMKAWKRPVYYDQQGVLSRRLGLHAVPALVSQEGKRLRIDELVVP